MESYSYQEQICLRNCQEEGKYFTVTLNLKNNYPSRIPCSLIQSNGRGVVLPMLKQNERKALGDLELQEHIDMEGKQ